MLLSRSYGQKSPAAATSNPQGWAPNPTLGVFLHSNLILVFVQKQLSRILQKFQK